MYTYMYTAVTKIETFKCHMISNNYIRVRHIHCKLYVLSYFIPSLKPFAIYVRDYYLWTKSRHKINVIHTYIYV